MSRRNQNLAIALLACMMATSYAYAQNAQNSSGCPTLGGGEIGAVLGNGRLLVSHANSDSLRIELGLSKGSKDSVRIETDSARCEFVRRQVIAAAPGLGKAAVQWPPFAIASLNSGEYLVDSLIREGCEQRPPGAVVWLCHHARWFFVVRRDSTVRFLGLQ